MADVLGQYIQTVSRDDNGVVYERCAAAFFRALGNVTETVTTETVTYNADGSTTTTIVHPDSSSDVLVEGKTSSLL